MLTFIVIAGFVVAFCLGGLTVAVLGANEKRDEAAE